MSGQHCENYRPWQTRTHCCGHIVADTNVSPFARARNICCGHKFCVRDTKNVSTTNVPSLRSPRNIRGQKNVSSFTRALSRWPLLHVIGGGLILSLESQRVFQNLLLFCFALEQITWWLVPWGTVNFVSFESRDTKFTVPLRSSH